MTVCSRCQEPQQQKVDPWIGDCRAPSPNGPSNGIYIYVYIYTHAYIYIGFKVWGPNTYCNGTWTLWEADAGGRRCFVGFYGMGFRV